MYSKRELLRTIGVSASIAGLVTAGSVTTGAREGKPVTEVTPFFDQEVPVGNSIKHRLTWIENCGTKEEIYERLREFKRKVKLEVEIEGVTIDDPSQYWSEPFAYDTEKGIYGVSWVYLTEPRSPDTYDFNVKMILTEPYTSPPFGNCDETKTLEGVRFARETTYTVTPDAGAGNKPEDLVLEND